MGRRHLLVILCCVMLVLVWIASRLRVPLSLFSADYGRKRVVDGQILRQFVLGTPEETEAEVLFHQEMNGYNTSRIPALIYHQDMFLAFCEGRKETFYDIGEMDILLRRGVRKGWKVTWEPVRVLARKPGYRMMDPVPIVDAKINMILLVYNAHQSDIDLWDEVAADKYQTNLMVIKSFDLGQTWTPPQDITEETVGKMKPTPTVYGPGPGHGIQTTTGRLIVPGKFFVKTEPGQKEFRNGTIHQANVIYSDDHGLTWRPGGSIPYSEHETTGIAMHVGEPTVVEIDDRQLCINVRTMYPDHPRLISFSRDEGMSFSMGQLAWTLVEPGYHPEENYTMQEQPLLLEDNFTRPIVNAGCEASMIGFPAPDSLSPSRTWVVFSNPASPKFRSKMGLRISKDGCQTWSSPWTIHANASAYSDLAYFETWDSDAKVRSPNIAILFEAGKFSSHETIQFKMFSLERLMQGVGLST